MFLRNGFKRLMEFLIGPCSSTNGNDQVRNHMKSLHLQNFKDDRLTVTTGLFVFWREIFDNTFAKCESTSNFIDVLD